MRIKIFWLIIPIAVLLLPVRARADGDHLMLSQIQTTGGAGHTTNDFIELYNPTAQDLDLKGYRLVKRTKTGTTDTSLKSWTASTIIKAHGFYLWANSAFTDLAVVPDATTTGSIADDNGVALRNGANDTGTIVDSVAWGTAANIFTEGVNFATNPAANQSLERLPTGDLGNGTDTNNNAVDFVLQTVSHPRNSQSPATPAIVIPPPAEPPPEEPPSIPPADNSAPPAEPPPEIIPPLYSSAILISEFMPNPDGPDGGEEWVEVYNNSDQAVDLADWILDDEGQFGEVGSSAYVVPVNSVVGPNAYLAIMIPDGKFAINNTGGDMVRLLWPDKTQLAQVVFNGNAKEDYSFARKLDGTYDWTELVTKGAANQFASPPALGVSSSAETQIKLNEIFPNPIGPDSGNEWVEVKNIGLEPVSLHNWVLDDGGTDLAIGSSSYQMASPRPSSMGEARPSSTGAAIVYPDGLAVIMIPAGKFAMNNTGGDTVRLFNENKILIDSVIYTGGPEGQSYALVDGQWVWSDPTPNAVNTEKLPPPEPPIADLVISELYPEPMSGEEEFIEIFNRGSTTADLHGWAVSDLVSTYTFHSPLIEPGGFYVLKKSESKLSLNNSGKERVSLVDPNNHIVAAVEYEDAPKNQSYNLLPDGTFSWSSISTPGEPNQIKIATALAASGKVKGLSTLPRTGNDLADRMSSAFVLWAIIWYIYSRLIKEQSYE